MNNVEKQENLNNIIEELSTDLLEEAGVRAFSTLINEIYKDNFRHSYSSITGRLLRLAEAENLSVIENVMQNLDMIYEFLSVPTEGIMSTEEVLGKIEKLKDHISLEYIRQSKQNSSFQMQIGSVNNKIEEAEKNYNKAEKLLNESKSQVGRAIREAQKVKTEVVTILGIFAAIILSFMGGMSFSASTFAGIASASVYRVTFVALIIGLVVFNTISVLLYIVSKIVDKPIYSKCITDDCSCEEQCSIQEKIKKRLPLIYWINKIFLILMGIIVLAWAIDAYEIIEHFRHAFCGVLFGTSS